MYHQITIKTLKAQGKNNSEIGRIVGIHRNTVHNILSREVIEKQVRVKPSSFSTYHSRITELLNKGLSKLRVWEILRDEYATPATYSAFIKYCTDHITAPKQAFIVQGYAPGEEAEIDFGYAGVVPAFASSTVVAKKVKVLIFVMTLSYSRLGFYLGVTDQSAETFIKAFESAFTYFCGVPKEVKIDNLKAGVVTNTRYDLEFNRTFLDFSFHYRFIIKPCPPREPHIKGKVEKGVDYVKNNFLAGRTFTDLNDLNRQLKDWMINTANKRIHGTTKRIPYEMFSLEEQKYLQQLPQSIFPLTPSLIRKVAANCHIHLNNSYYSVPAQFVGELVEARIKGNLITLFHQNEQIATHVTSPTPGTYVTIQTHYPQEQRYSHTTYQAKYEAKMQAIGENTHQFFLETVKQTHLWVGITRRILKLAQDYGKEKVDRACKRALIFGAVKAGVVERICKENLDALEIEPHLIKAQQEQMLKNQSISQTPPQQPQSPSFSHDKQPAQELAPAQEIQLSQPLQNTPPQTKPAPNGHTKPTLTRELAYYSQKKDNGN